MTSVDWEQRAHQFAFDHKLGTVAVSVYLAGVRAAQKDIVDECALEFEDPRIQYVTVQMSRETWAELQSAKESS